MALSTAILTVLTLGLYRFWMVTKLRSHYWQSIRIKGDPLEYTGTGLEKILGFLVAIIILAIYLGLVNVGLTFVGISYFAGHPLALQISILAAAPLFFFAEYRARRYIMARTRWRGIRFGMGDGALGYTLRAMWLWFLTLISFGLLYPYKQFKLAKYVTDRSWFGDMKFKQGGSWAGLFAYWVWIYIVVGLMALAFWGIVADTGNPSTTVIGALILLAGNLGLYLMILRYEVAAFRYMWSHRSLGEAQFECTLAPAAVIRVYVFGSLGVFFFASLVGGILIALAAISAFALIGADRMAAFGQMENLPALLAEWQVLVIFGFAYLAAIAASYAFTQVFITRPILRRQAESMIITKFESLMAVSQREHDHAAEAGGFADALGVDVGAGF